MSSALHLGSPHLEAYLASGRAPEFAMQISDLDGFLTGLVLGGADRAETDWMGFVWSGEDPAFESAEEKALVIGDIRSHLASLRRSALKTDWDPQPILTLEDDGRYDAEAWAQGFIQAIEAYPHNWAEPMARARASLDRIASMCMGPDGVSLAGTDYEREAALLDEFALDQFLTQISAIQRCILRHGLPQQQELDVRQPQRRTAAA